MAAGRAAPVRVLDIEIYDEWGESHWAQARYLVHGLDDVLWTDDAAEALEYLSAELGRIRSKG
jgi:hypothetical protein